MTAKGEGCFGGAVRLLEAMAAEGSCGVESVGCCGSVVECWGGWSCRVRCTLMCCCNAVLEATLCERFERVFGGRARSDGSETRPTEVDVGGGEKKRRLVGVGLGCSRFLVPPPLVQVQQE